jgi:GDP-4-dehydro-6-deoxy-D-mannose reductase
MSCRKVLITGAQGFIGSRLLPLLCSQGHEAAASAANLLDFRALGSELGSTPWDLVIHLAAISHVPSCESDPSAAVQVNVGGTALLLEALRRHCPSARLIFASTAQVYAAPEGPELQSRIVMTEDRRIAPQNLYARTKRAAENLIEEACRLDRLKATVLRLFNHSHHSQSPDFFLPHLFHELQKAKRDPRPGVRARISVGNLGVSRDIGALSDLLRAFASLVARPTSIPELEIFNVCSGTSKELAKLADCLVNRLNVQADFVTDPARLRNGEPASIQGSYERLSQATGWAPQFARDESGLIDSFLAD